MKKWEVKVLPADQKGDAYLGVCCGETIVLAPIRNRGEGELICAAVNAMCACAGPLEMDPIEFARLLYDYPQVGVVVKKSIEAVEMVVRHVVRGRPREWGPPSGVYTEPSLEKEDDDERAAAEGPGPGDA